MVNYYRLFSINDIKFPFSLGVFQGESVTNKINIKIGRFTEYGLKLIKKREYENIFDYNDIIIENSDSRLIFDKSNYVISRNYKTSILIGISCKSINIQNFKSNSLNHCF